MIPVQGRVPSQWNDETVGHLTRRLQAIERALGGSAQVFNTPASPTFGAGAGQVADTASGSTTVITGVTDHGALLGREDDDHEQYEFRGQPAEQHVHGEADVVGLESRFVVRGEQATPEPHAHRASDVLGIDAEFVRRGEGETHAHTLADMADFSLLEMMLWREVYGG